jgi:hypothetical protein
VRCGGFNFVQEIVGQDEFLKEVESAAPHDKLKCIGHKNGREKNNSLARELFDESERWD